MKISLICKTCKIRQVTSKPNQIECSVCLQEKRHDKQLEIDENFNRDEQRILKLRIEKQKTTLKTINVDKHYCLYDQYKCSKLTTGSYCREHEELFEFIADRKERTVVRQNKVSVETPKMNKKTKNYRRSTAWTVVERMF